MLDETKVIPLPQQRATASVRRWHFDHHRLDAWHVSLEALVQGDAIARAVPKGYGKLKDQLQRALVGAYTQTTEAAARTGADRAARFRIARAEAGEAAGALEALARLGVADAGEVDVVVGLLWRLCAMLTRLAQARR
jgi:four helix bundle protein